MLDEAIRIIRASDGKPDASPKLIARFGLTEIQADAVLETKLYRLGKLENQDILDTLKKKSDRGDEIERIVDIEPGGGGSRGGVAARAAARGGRRGAAGRCGGTGRVRSGSRRRRCSRCGTRWGTR